jgi:SAM-dependent methyltransferase
MSHSTKVHQGACVARTAVAARALRDRLGLSAGSASLLVESGVEQVGSREPDRAESVYMADGGDRFDRVHLDASFQLIQSEWATALLRRLLERTAPGGLLSLPLKCLPGHRRTLDAMHGWVGRALMGMGDPSAGAEELTFRRTDSSPCPRASSTLEWFMDQWRVALDIAVAGRLSESPSTDAAAERIRQASALGYYIGGLSYKAPLLRFIMRQHAVGRGARIVDMGAGYGLLPAELLLDPELGVAHATATDISTLNESLATALGAGLGASGPHFAFALSPAQEFSFEGAVDVISYVGSLLYVPREHLAKCLERAWGALRPGGILVIHENIRDPKYVRDFKFMFEVDELDAALSRLGPVRRFASTREQELSKADAASKTVFRVVQRPAA